MAPGAIAEFAALLAELKAAGHTVVIAEHRLYFLRGLADQVLLLAGGRIAERFTGAEFFALDEAARRRLGLRSLTAPLLPPRAPRSDTTAAPAPGPGDLLLHIRATRTDACFELAMRIREQLGDAVVPVTKSGTV